MVFDTEASTEDSVVVLAGISVNDRAKEAKIFLIFGQDKRRLMSDPHPQRRYIHGTL